MTKKTINMDMVREARANLERIAAAVEKGPLSAELDGLIRAAFRREGTKWTAQI